MNERVFTCLCFVEVKMFKLRDQVMVQTFQMTEVAARMAHGSPSANGVSNRKYLGVLDDWCFGPSLCHVGGCPLNRKLLLCR